MCKKLLTNLMGGQEGPPTVGVTNPQEARRGKVRSNVDLMDRSVSPEPDEQRRRRSNKVAGLGL